MLKKTTFVLCFGLTVAGCARLADSRINPLNWFGRSAPVASATSQTEAPRPLIPRSRGVQIVDGRSLIHSVTALSIDRTPSGAIIRATGEADSQGQFNAELVLVSAENGALIYDFRIERPAGYQAQGSSNSRVITAAATLSAAELQGVRSIRVQAANNARSTRR